VGETRDSGGQSGGASTLGGADPVVPGAAVGRSAGERGVQLVREGDADRAESGVDARSGEQPPAGRVSERSGAASVASGKPGTGAYAAASGAGADAAAAHAGADAAAPGGGAEEDEEADRGTPGRVWGSLLRAGTRSPAGVLIGVLIGLLGFALAVQLRSNTSTSGLPAARQEDLVRILDELSAREDRLRRQIADLEAARTRLSTTGDRSTAALEEARRRSTTLEILAGTVVAQGPGIQLTLTDPAHRLTAEDLLDAVEELRAAGAEALQIGTVRIGVDSAFTTTDSGGIAVAGTTLTAPYMILAIGDPATLATAMGIPGGIADTVDRAGGEARIVQQDLLVVRALRSLREPQYSRPADGGR